MKITVKFEHDGVVQEDVIVTQEVVGSDKMKRPKMDEVKTFEKLGIESYALIVVPEEGATAVHEGVLIKSCGNVYSTLNSFGYAFAMLAINLLKKDDSDADIVYQNLCQLLSFLHRKTSLNLRGALAQLFMVKNDCSSSDFMDIEEAIQDKKGIIQ